MWHDTHPLVVEFEPDFILAVHVVQAAGIVLSKWSVKRYEGQGPMAAEARASGRRRGKGGHCTTGAPPLTGFSISRM